MVKRKGELREQEKKKTLPAHAEPTAHPRARLHARPRRVLRPSWPRDAANMADGEDGCPAGREPGPEPGEEFEIVDRSQLPSPGELRSAAKPRTGSEGWSAPILTLARKATGNLSASCGSALRAAAGLGGADSGTDGAARAGRLRPGTPRARPRDRWPFGCGSPTGEGIEPSQPVRRVAQNQPVSTRPYSCAFRPAVQAESG